jgi:ankyrin repeat protein
VICYGLLRNLFSSKPNFVLLHPLWLPSISEQAGCSALYRACTANCPDKDMVQLLVDAGADVNLASADAGTPLGVAARNGYVEVVRVLLEAGAEVDTINNVSADLW